MTTTDFINKNVTVIIRTVGERTTELCYELVRKQIAEKNIHLISETPFTEALRKTFKTGLKENRKWTFTVDADVLIKPGVLKELIAYAEQLENKVFKIEGQVIDKFLNSPREAGNHLYRTDYVDKAIKFIPKPELSIRPETDVRNAMHEVGFTFIKSNILVGFHDYEQYYKDIYKKCFFQAAKHRERVIKLIKEWKELAEFDKDFFIAITGFMAGCRHSGPILIDYNYSSFANVGTIIESIPMKEKQKMKHNNYTDNEKYLLMIANTTATIAAKYRKELICEDSLNSSKYQGNIYSCISKGLSAIYSLGKRFLHRVQLLLSKSN